MKQGQVVRVGDGVKTAEGVEVGGLYGVVEGSLYSVPGHVLVGLSGEGVDVQGVMLLPESDVTNPNIKAA